MENGNENARTEQFVRDVLKNLLETADIPEEWVQPWIVRAIQLDDPIAAFNEMATTRANVDRLKRSRDAKTFWPNGHFYSPVVSQEEAKKDWHRITRDRALLGIDLNLEGQINLLRRLVKHFTALPFANRKTWGLRYFFENGCYNYGDALIYWSIINELRPQRIIEIGSGFSSALALDAIDLLALNTKATFIDPFPEALINAAGPILPPHGVLSMKVQDVGLEIFDELGRDDILFIDSSHVVKTGSDVHFELTEILPRLKPGVVIHFHDVIHPFEYGAPWITVRNYSWNEAYFLHAFLMYNDQFEIILFNSYIVRHLPDDIRMVAPTQCDRFKERYGAGFWLRRA